MASDGVVRRQTAAERLVPTIRITRFCHVKIVSSKPIVPVIGISEGGMLDGVAWSWAADELIPSVKPNPSPR